MDYSKIKDRYQQALKKPETLPTIEQSIFAWALLNELIEIGYPHNFQNERSDLARFGYNISGLLDKAHAIKGM